MNFKYFTLCFIYLIFVSELYQANAQQTEMRRFFMDGIPPELSLFIPNVYQFKFSFVAVALINFKFSDEINQRS